MHLFGDQLGVAQVDVVTRARKRDDAHFRSVGEP